MCRVCRVSCVSCVCRVAHATCDLVKVFHKPVPSAKQGDRVGMCVTQLDSKLLERGLAATPGSVATMTSAIAALRRIKYFKQPILNRTKFHGTRHTPRHTQRLTRTQWHARAHTVFRAQ